MFEECIKESKPRPGFAGTDDYQVSLTLKGEVQNPRFLTFLQHVTVENLGPFRTQDLMVLDAVQREESVPPHLQDRLIFLKERDIVEVTGLDAERNQFYPDGSMPSWARRAAVTRTRGLDRETKKALLFQHRENFSGDSGNGKNGSWLSRKARRANVTFLGGLAWRPQGIPERDQQRT